jgi:hypothetical protein
MALTHGKRDFEDAITLRILRWATTLDYPNGFSVIKSPYRGKQEVSQLGEMWPWKHKVKCWEEGTRSQGM